jgi:hypothetical protein
MAGVVMRMTYHVAVAVWIAVLVAAVVYQVVVTVCLL